MLSSLGLGLGLLRSAAAPAPARAFSTTAVAQVLKSHSGAKKRFRVTAGGLVSSVRVGGGEGVWRGKERGVHGGEEE